MANYTEEQVSKALLEIQQGRPLARAAKEWHIPRSTLQSRLAGRQPRAVAFEAMQQLSRAQKDRLTQWILTQVDLGLPPTHAQIKELAQRVLQERGDTTTLGKRWLNRFLARHPILKTQRARSMEHTRVNGATEDVIRPWFSHLAIPTIKAIKPANRWNIDEADIIEGMGVNGLVVGSAEKRAILNKKPGTRV
ncbi:hypothetical protein VTI74DRAFT_2290 [Chaetomium olivicolor]